MTSPVFLKRYTDPSRGVACRSHHRWLTSLASGVRMPELHPGSGTHLVYEWLPGTHATPADVECAAAALGALHGAAYTAVLHQADLRSPLQIRPGLQLAAFTAGRRIKALARVGIDISRSPAALYKDANVRNFLVTPGGAAMVDFDDLTLAPFGYDLAKLLVTAAMTYGRLPPGTAEAMLSAYITASVIAGGPAASCSLPQLTAYAEVHHLLTRSYLHTNGYRHSWPEVRSC